MAISINRRILEKINESKCDDDIKNLLKNLLAFELENIEIGNKTFSKQYDNFIETFLKEDEL